MKRLLSMLLAAAVLIGSAAFAGIPQAKAEMNEVTILAYICGTDLESDEGEASADIREMLSAGIGGETVDLTTPPHGGRLRRPLYL